MNGKTSKVGVIGAGSVGAAVANALVLLRKCVPVVLFDRTLSKAEGQAWDIADAIGLRSEMDVIPTNRYEDLADCDVIVITSGATQKDGESRLDLLEKNADILRGIIKELDRVAPNAIAIIVSKGSRCFNADSDRKFSASGKLNFRFGHSFGYCKAAISIR
ncbi:MAG: hypothetical protein ACHBN1_37875 [Heteroscytonema crispum UTEX LB 1556]